jgi:hypothetical protein
MMQFPRSGMPSFLFHEFTHRSATIKASPELHKTLSGLPEGAIPEVSAYFNEAWGNRSRIDYGSGMELNFLCWM